MTPASIIVDGPLCIDQGAGLGQKCFRNFSGGYAGSQTMRWGLEQSRNLMTVRAAITGVTFAITAAFVGLLKVRARRPGGALDGAAAARRG